MAPRDWSVTAPTYPVAVTRISSLNGPLCHFVFLLTERERKKKKKRERDRERDTEREAERESS